MAESAEEPKPSLQGPEQSAPSTHQETWATRIPAAPEEAAQRETVVNSAAAPTLIQTIQIPGYEILEDLGRGGMGVVYKARQKGLNRLVALKMILAGEHASRDDLERFRTEAEAPAHLQHPHIIQVYEIDEHEGRPYFSMEYVDGGSLAERVRDLPHPPREAAQLIEMLARAVHIAHAAGIIHRDLKPANVLMAFGRESLTNALAGGVPKITDFGLAKRLEGNQNRTRTGEILGTPNYMAPEQASGRSSQIGPATDIHALGAILYHLLTGKPPFGKESLLDTLEQVRSQRPTPPSQLAPEIPRDLEVICLKCLQKEPGDRYLRAADLADDLHCFLEGEPIKARPLSRGERFVRWFRRTPLRGSLLLGAIAFIPLLLLGLSLVFRERVFEDSEIRRNGREIRRGLFERVYNNRLPDGWIRNELGREDSGHEPWSHAQTLCAALRCPEASQEELRDLLSGLEVLRTGIKRIKRGDVHYGWMPREGVAYTQAEPILWAAAAIAEALQRPGLLEGETRRQQEEFLAEVHLALRTYAPTQPDGGWHVVPNPRNPRLVNTYVNVLALLVLLDTRRAGLSWDGSIRRRDELIKQTSDWLVSTFEPAAPAGWRKDNGAKDQTIDGLSLQAYAVLLRAANEAGYTLPPAIVSACQSHLLDCRKRDMSVPNLAPWASYAFTRHDGEPGQLSQNPTMLWYPWAVEAAAQWLKYSRRNDLNVSERGKVQQVLGHLVIELRNDVVTSGETFVYITAERLYALCSLAE